MVHEANMTPTTLICPSTVVATALVRLIMSAWAML